VRWGKSDLPIEAWARRVIVPAALIVAALFALRRAVAGGFELGRYEFLFDKWHLGPIRVLNFIAVAAVLIVAQAFFKPLAFRPLVLLGQSSLQVFCVHLLFCFAGLTLMGNASMLDGWRQAALLTATFSAMLLTAKVFSKSEGKQERPPKNAENPQPVVPKIKMEPPDIVIGGGPMAASLPAPGD